MKITNFADNGIPIALGGWSTGITSLSSNVTTADGGISAVNFVQRITANGSNILLNPSINFAAGSNITLAAASNTITIYGSAGGGGGVTYGSPAIVLGTAAAVGAIDEAIRRDSTIVAFDATVPVTQASGDAAAAGSAAVAARRDHKHGMPSLLADPMTTRGDMIVRDAANATARLAVGAANRLVRSNGTDVSWGQVVEADLGLTDLTTADASTGQHGLLKKLPGGTTTFLRADGAFATPAGGSGVAIDDEASVVAMELFL